MKKFIYALLISLTVLIYIRPSEPAPQKNAQYYNEEGWAHLKKGADYKAVFSFRNALKRNSKYLDALIGLANAYYKIEAYELSRDLYEDALKIDKKNKTATAGIGLTLSMTGNYPAALKYLNEAVKLSGDDLSARYGIARLYYLMGKMIWAKRGLEGIFNINPYHYDSLLLMAQIKTDEGRFSDAKGYVERAVQVNSEHPDGYIKLGELYLSRYLNGGNESGIDEGIAAFNQALSVQPESYHANRLMGFVSLLKKDYSAAAEYFTKSSSEINNSSILYSIGVSYDLAADGENAFKFFLAAYKLSPFDSILRARLEDFMVLRDYKIGHPARIMLNGEHFNLAKNRIKKDMPDEAMMYLRRSAIMNPMHTQTREELMDYYKTLDYGRFYIDELKDMMRLYPDGQWGSRLEAAVVKRRDSLDYTEGYSQEEPPRDVPQILVLNFDSGGRITAHPDAGMVLADNLNFVLGQFGRMKPFGMRTRRDLSAGLIGDPDRIEESLSAVGALVKKGEIDPVDYVVYGTYFENGQNISLEFMLLDLKKGYIISEFNLSESGKEALPSLSLRAARRIYQTIPYSGRPLKIKDDGIIVNLGLYDGLSKGDVLAVNKVTAGKYADRVAKNMIVFTIKDINTLICYAEPAVKSDMDLLDARDVVYPVKKRRAVRIK